MSNLNFTGEEILAWVETTSTKWHDLITKHPEILTLHCDIINVKTAGELLQHIVAVELRYAERLSDLPATDYANIPYSTVDEIYATHDRAIALFKTQLASDVDWNEAIDFMTRTMGPARATRKTIFVHAMMHGIRHYAQLATLVRQHGINPGWPMDYLMMGFSRA